MSYEKNDRLPSIEQIQKVSTYSTEFYGQWYKICKKLKESGYDLSKIKLTKKG